MSARLWYYPDPGSGVESIDLGELWSDLQATPQPIRSSTATLAGGMQTASLGSTYRVRAVLERFTSEAMYHKLRTLESHLHRGGRVSLAESLDSAWCSFLTRDRLRGATKLYTEGNVLEPLGGGPLVAGQYIRISSALPTGTHEYARVDSIDGNTLTLTEGLTYSHRAQPVLVTHMGFWPVLRLAPNSTAPIVTHDRRITYTLDLELVEDAPAIVALAENIGSLRGPIAGSNPGTPAGRGSLGLDDLDAIPRTNYAELTYDPFVRYPR